MAPAVQTPACISSGAAPSSLPIAIIDLSKSADEIAVDLRRACEEVGFFYLINHGVDLKLREEVFRQSKLFFDLPVEEKLKIKETGYNRGYVAFGTQALNKKNQSKGDTKEGYYLGREVPLPVHEDGTRAMEGPNLWVDPELVPSLRPTMERYTSELNSLGHRVLTHLAAALELEGDYFNQPGRCDDALVTLLLLHYAAEKSDPETGVFGAGAHTDFGVFTLLATDDNPGLQICRDRERGVWENVPPMAGAFVVNIGDVTERWTNNRFRSTLHRVVGNGNERYSVAFFFESNHDCVVECLPTCTSVDNPPKYPPILFGKYLDQRLSASVSK